MREPPICINTVGAAKDYLAGRIAEQARREGEPLSEIEHKMLYFTEQGGITPSMMGVSEEFDRDYDQDEYEQRIAALIRAIYASDAQASERTRETWNEAIAKLAGEDHYILILIDAAKLASDTGSSSIGRLRPWMPTLDRRGSRDGADLVRLVLVGIGIFAVLLVACCVASIMR